MKLIRTLGLLVMGLLLSALYGCASLGDAFQPVANVPADKALVYIYRPNKFVGGGAYYTVRANDKPITKLYNGGYYPYIANPGELQISAKTESTSSVTLDLRPGDIQYVKGMIGVGFLMGRPNLTLVDAAVGGAEIKECKLIPEQNFSE